MGSKYLYVITHDVDNLTLNEIDINLKDDFVWTNLKMYIDLDELLNDLRVLYSTLAGFKFCNFRIARYIVLNKTFCFDSYIPIDMNKIKTINK
jgi:hypothetical protein